MQLKKLMPIILSSITAVGSMFATADAAHASKLLSGVAIQGSTKGNSVFMTSDPVYGNAYNYSTYQLTVLKSPKVGAGVNLPARNNGNNILPNVGRFEELQYYYDTNFGAPVPVGGLTVVIQTNDGFSRIATPSSSLYNTANGFNTYQLDLVPSDFSPSFSPDQTRLRTASIRYNGSIGPIYAFFPVLVGQSGTLQDSDFNFRTNADSAFNN